MLEAFKQDIETHLESSIPSEENSLYFGARHVLLSGGKRIRPLLTLCVAQMLDPSVLKASLGPACAIEYVHTYSLVHDDLPCMDDDDMRRGKPTLHRLLTEAHAVLTGDYLLTRAFELLADAPQLSDSTKIELVKTLAYASGDRGMIGGQILDIEQSQEIETLHSLKTGALFQVAALFGGIVTESSKETCRLLRTFGMLFGQLFQMVDDVLDGDHPLGEAHALQTSRALYEKTLDHLSLFQGDAQYLKELTERVFLQVQAVR